jgi:anti-anti-sigma factor
MINTVDTAEQLSAAAFDARMVRVGPFLDCRNVALVRQQINHAIAAGPGVIALDMQELDGIDAVGLGMLAAAHLRADQAGCQLRLRGPRPSVRRVLAVTRLNRILRLDRPMHLSA